MRLDDKLIDGEVIKTYCISCLVPTNQLIRTKFAPKSQAEYEHYEHNEYCTAECLGCNNISFLHVKWDDDEESKDENGNPIKIISYFIEDERWFEDYEFLNDQDLDELPAMIFEMYEELQEALQREMRLLAGVGMRMLIEAVCLNQKIAGKSLQDQIGSLLNSGHISKNDFDVLVYSFLFIVSMVKQYLYPPFSISIGIRWAFDLPHQCSSISWFEVPALT